MGISFRGLAPTLQGFYQERRPILKTGNETSRKGVFLCGDLAGEPLLKMSMHSGQVTAESVAEALSAQSDNSTNGVQEADCDVLICGSGGAGLSAALKLKEHGLSSIVLEKDQLGQTIRDFPVGKLIYARPYEWSIGGPLDVGDCTREEFLDKAAEVCQNEGIDVRENAQVVNIEDLSDGTLSVVTADDRTFTARAVILAMGRRGNARKLGVTGEDLPHVHDKVLHPHGYEGRRVCIVGGGNSAVEAALALSDNDAEVTLSYRKDEIFRASKENKERFHEQVDNGKIRFIPNSSVTRITEENVELQKEEETETLPVDDVFVLIGAEAPTKLLNQLRVRIENTWDGKRWFWFAIAFLGMWLFYSFGKWGAGNSWKEFPWSLLGAASKVLPGFMNPAHVKALIYSLAVVGFGIPAIKRWRRAGRIVNYQTARYITIFISQTLFLFIIPEFILPAMNRAVHLWETGNYWRFYGVMMPFPLVYDTFFFYNEPDWFWIIACLLAAFVILPIFIYWHGKRLCSWICGCGCLADTLGDRFRHYAPQGDGSRKLEGYLLWPVLMWAFLSTIAYLIISGGTGDAPMYVSLYRGLVDFLLASVLGVALYFFLGNRIWCRYFCPLAHYMRLLSALYSKFRIKPADRCIACGECSRYCQMGIDVMQFALKDQNVNNKNSSCIGCGICVSVCPMDNLTMGNEFPNNEQYQKKS